MSKDVSAAFTADEAADLRRLLDQAEIWRSLTRYARGVDRLDEDLVRSAFWKDAHDAHGAFHGSPEEFIEWFRPTQPDREVCQHYLSTFSVTFTGKDTARSETYFISAGKLCGSDDLSMLGGRYDDEWERRDGEWRLSSRLVIMDWRAVSDASGMAEQLASWHTGSRDRNDPSYAPRVERRTSL